MDEIVEKSWRRIKTHKPFFSSENLWGPKFFNIEKIPKLMLNLFKCDIIQTINNILETNITIFEVEQLNSGWDHKQ